MTLESRWDRPELLAVRVVFIELLDELETQNGLDELVYTVSTVKAHHFLAGLLFTTGLFLTSQSYLLCINLVLAVIGLPIFCRVRGQPTIIFAIPEKGSKVTTHVALEEAPVFLVLGRLFLLVRRLWHAQDVGQIVLILLPLSFLTLLGLFLEEFHFPLKFGSLISAALLFFTSFNITLLALK